MNIMDKFLINTYERVAFRSFSLSKFRNADKYFRKILKIEPDRLGTCYNLGMVNYAMGNYDEAEKYLSRERARIGDTYELCRALGDVYWYKKDRESALRFYKFAKNTALKEKDRVLMTKKMGLCASDRSFVEALGAAQIFEQADALMNDKKYEEAEAMYIRGIEKDPTNFFALNNLAVINMNIKMDYDAAGQYLKSGDEMADLPLITDNLKNLAKLRRRSGR